MKKVHMRYASVIQTADRAKKIANNPPGVRIGIGEEKDDRWSIKWIVLDYKSILSLFCNIRKHSYHLNSNDGYSECTNLYFEYSFTI